MELYPFRQDRHEGLEALPRLHDLWLDEMARMGAGGGGFAAVHQGGAREGHQFLRHGRRLFARARARKSWAARSRISPSATDVVIATKVFNPMGPSANARGLSRKHIMEAIDASLKRLGTDYVDLYQIHRFDSDDADRGDGRGAERRRARRQGALCRRLLDVDAGSSRG